MIEEDRRSYDAYWAYLGQELGILATAKEEGRAEERIEVAKEMLKEGDSIEKISRVSKLSIDTIEKFAKEIGL